MTTDTREYRAMARPPPPHDDTTECSFVQPHKPKLGTSESARITELQQICPGEKGHFIL